jgi:hypothetical protein
MTDLPILFSAPMIRALLEGRKTMTRRLMKLQPSLDWRPFSYGEVHKMINGEPSEDHVIGWGPSNEDGDEAYPLKYLIGQRLWVREAWRTDDSDDDGIKPSLLSPKTFILYDADADWRLNKSVGKSRSPRFMPRWASRLTLVVTDVKVERVQDISDEDAEKEGAEFTPYMNSAYEADGDYINDFQNIWNSIHGPGAWERNDWVEAVTFTVHNSNIERMPQ